MVFGRKIVIVLVVSAAVLIAGAFFIYRTYYRQETSESVRESTEEEKILQSLTAPVGGSGDRLNGQMLTDLTARPQSTTSAKERQDIIDSLSAPQ